MANNRTTGRLSASDINQFNVVRLTSWSLRGSFACYMNGLMSWLCHCLYMYIWILNTDVNNFDFKVPLEAFEWLLLLEWNFASLWSYHDESRARVLNFLINISRPISNITLHSSSEDLLTKKSITYTYLSFLNQIKHSYLRKTHFGANFPFSAPSLSADYISSAFWLNIHYLWRTLLQVALRIIALKVALQEGEHSCTPKCKRLDW